MKNYTKAIIASLISVSITACGGNANDWYRVDNCYSSEKFRNATQEVHIHDSEMSTQSLLIPLMAHTASNTVLSLKMNLA